MPNFPTYLLLETFFLTLEKDELCECISDNALAYTRTYYNSIILYSNHVSPQSRGHMGGCDLYQQLMSTCCLITVNPTVNFILYYLF